MNLTVTLSSRARNSYTVDELHRNRLTSSRVASSRQAQRQAEPPASPLHAALRSCAHCRRRECCCDIFYLTLHTYSK
eukprot:6203787-Pleurochrysis_carterae.AAC.4